MGAYEIVLSLHNLLRWVVVILAVWALVRAYLGWFQNRPWTEQDRKVGTFFGISIDIQLLLGLILYFVLSPITRAAMQNFGAAMRQDELRFFGLEHFFYMILAVIFVHLGSVLARRANGDTQKHRRAAIFFTLTALTIILGIPWWRPLLRLG